MSDYYVTMFEQERGPYSADDLQQMAKDGTLSRAALIRCPNGESIRAERIHALWDFVGRKWFPLWLFISLGLTVSNGLIFLMFLRLCVYTLTTAFITLILICVRRTWLRYLVTAIVLYLRIPVSAIMLALVVAWVTTCPGRNAVDALWFIQVGACLTLADTYFAWCFHRKAASIRYLYRLQDKQIR